MGSRAEAIRGGHVHPVAYVKDITESFLERARAGTLRTEPNLGLSQTGLIQYLDTLKRTTDIAVAYDDLFDESVYASLATDFAAKLSSLESVVLLDNLEVVSGALTQLVDAFVPLGTERRKIADEVGATLQNQALQLETLTASAAGKRSLEEVRRLQQAVIQATTTVGEVKISEDFGSAASSELASANRFRQLTYALLFLAFLAAGYVALNVNGYSWKEALARLAVDVPLLGAAYLSSSEAKDHRRNARYERGWQSRINTIEAFCAPLPETQRNEVRAAFALVLYAAPPDLGGGQTLAEANQMMIDQAKSLVKMSKTISTPPSE